MLLGEILDKIELTDKEKIELLDNMYITIKREEESEYKKSLMKNFPIYNLVS